MDEAAIVQQNESFHAVTHSLNYQTKQVLNNKYRATMAPKISDQSERSWDSSDFQECGHQPQQEQMKTEVIDVEEKQKQKKTVRFSPTAKVRQVPKWSKVQSQNVWFNFEDFNEMKRSFAPTVQLMMQGVAPEEDTEDHCLRGLEYRTKDGAKKRMKNKFNGMAAVLHEQDRQSYENLHDPELLAEVYRQATYHCFLEALALGRKDERDIQDYIASENEPFYDILEEQQELQVSSSPKKIGLQASTSTSVPERGFRGSLKRFLSGSGRLMRRSSIGGAAA